MSDILFQHKKQFPNSFYIQVLGARGAGKSTFLNKIMKKIKDNCPGFKFTKAETGGNETTLKTDFYNLSVALDNKHGFKNVFLVDQPGIGGQKIREAGYLQQFSPGLFSK